MGMDKGKIVCFGELLLRLSPNMDRDWTSQDALPFYIGGAELNVATALANWQIPVSYVTALPDNYLSQQISGYICSNNIQADNILFSGNRIGIYYLSVGLDVKHNSVIYDRDHSSFADLKPGTINWDGVFEGCTCFHFSAISPALNKNSAAICKEALEAASAKGITISVDLNYRSKLWQYGCEPISVMPDLVAYCNVIMGNIWAVDSLLGIPSPVEDSDGKTQQELTDAAVTSMALVQLKYPKAATLAYTYRLQDTYFAVVKKDSETAVSKYYTIPEIKDRVGSGDCFMAGLIYGLYKDYDAHFIANYAAAAAVGKLQEAGDATKQSIENVEQRML